MAKWVRSLVLDNGLNDIKTNSTKQLLLSAYTLGDSYATVVANKIAEVVVDSADFVLSSSGLNRVITAGAQQATATASALGTPDLHIAFTNGVDAVIMVTDETSNQPVTSGNLINFPVVTFTANQPT